MASKSHRDMSSAVAFAQVYATQLKKYYQENKPKAKRIIPILDKIINAAEQQLVYFRKEICYKDLEKISKKVDSFNASTSQEMGKKETVSFIIGQLAERICELSIKNSKSGNIERIESVLKPMEELYEYFADVDRSHGAEETGTDIFRVWEAA